MNNLYRKTAHLKSSLSLADILNDDTVKECTICKKKIDCVKKKNYIPKYEPKYSIFFYCKNPGWKNDDWIFSSRDRFCKICGDITVNIINNILNIIYNPNTTRISII